MGAYETDQSMLTLDELAVAAQMTARNVRAYRTRGLLPPPYRVGRETRYGPEHLARLGEIRRLRAGGVPLRLIVEATRRGQDLGPGGELSAVAVGVRGPDREIILEGHSTASSNRAIGGDRPPLGTVGTVGHPAADLAAEGMPAAAVQAAVQTCVRVASTLAEELAAMLAEGDAGPSVSARDLLAELAATITRDVLRQELAPADH